MKRQIEMEETMRMTHNQFLVNFDHSLDFLEEELREADDIARGCTDEGCRYAEDLFDDLHKEVYAISEPRWLEDSELSRLKSLRNRLKDLYSRFVPRKDH